MAGRKLISAEVDSRSLKQLKQFERKLPSAIMNGIKDGSEAIANSLKIGASAHRWTGNLESNINVEQIDEKTFGISMPDYGFALDHMIPHFISLRRGRKITRWAADKGLVESPWTRKGGSIFVRPHPWIDNSLTNAPQQMEQHIQSQLEALV